MLDLGAQADAIGEGMANAIGRVLAHRRFVLGPEVEELEAALAARVGAAAVVSCANGTDALVLALRALGVAPGDRVVVPAFTFAATAEAVALVGAQPVFADIRPTDFAIDAGSIAAHLDAVAGPRPVGIIPVDLFGHPADHPDLSHLASEQGWWVLTDAAQSFGASSPAGSAGAVGTLATTSFFPSKPLGGYGDGGAVFCPTGDHEALLRSLRNHGAGSDRYENLRIGMNSRLDSIQAAVLLQKLTVLDEEAAARDRVAARYAEAFAGTPVQAPTVAAGYRSAWAQYTVRLPERDAIATALAAQGVGTAIYYHRPLHRQPAFAGAPTLGPLDVSEEACLEVLSLPMHPYLPPADQDRVASAVLDALASGERRP